MSLAATGLLASVLMFLVKNDRIKRICFYVVAALGIYMGYVGIRILWPGFLSQAVLSIVMAMISAVSLVLAWKSQGNNKKFKLAQVMAAAAMFIGMFNAFM